MIENNDWEKAMELTSQASTQYEIAARALSSLREIKTAEIGINASQIASLKSHFQSDIIFFLDTKIRI